MISSVHTADIDASAPMCQKQKSRGVKTSRSLHVWPSAETQSSDQKQTKKRTIGPVGATMVGRCFSGSSIRSIHFGRALHVKRYCTKKIWIRSSTFKKVYDAPSAPRVPKASAPKLPGEEWVVLWSSACKILAARFSEPLRVHGPHTGAMGKT